MLTRGLTQADKYPCGALRRLVRLTRLSNRWEGDLRVDSSLCNFGGRQESRHRAGRRHGRTVILIVHFGCCWLALESTRA